MNAVPPASSETKLTFQTSKTIECDALVVVRFEGTAAGDSPSSTEICTSFSKSSPVSPRILALAAQARRAEGAAVASGRGGGFISPNEVHTAATALRNAMGRKRRLRHLKSKSSRDIAMLLDSGFSGTEHRRRAVGRASSAIYEPDVLKSDKKDVKIVDHFTCGIGKAGATEEGKKSGSRVEETESELQEQKMERGKMGT